LAYKIKKESQAFFGWISFLANPEDVLLVRDKLKTTPILRFLIVENQPKKSSPAREAYRARKALTQNVEPPKERPSVLSNEALEQKLKEILQ
jgi:ribosomal protein S6